MFDTHQVFNQTPPLVDVDGLALDKALQEGLAREGAAWARDDLSRYSRQLTRPEVIALGFTANGQPPVFQSHSPQGARLDLVDYHPSYHQLMTMAFEEGLHASPWSDPRPGVHVARAAKYYLHCQVEAGHGCPVTMTFAAAPVLKRRLPDWYQKLMAHHYDPSNRPAEQKAALTLGMGMTEKQGGSDVRANSTRALALGDGSYELVGHKWFLSAPMSDGFLMLAQTDAGLSCFLVPRWWQGEKNPVEIQRLKNKLGNRSNASSEVELKGARAWLLGEEGKGVQTIIEMVALTRFDCMLGSSGGQRQAVLQAVHHAQHRQAFGKRLIDQPLMAAVLADLQLEVEGSLAMSLRMARALDNGTDPHEQALLRLGTAVGKFWICKRTPQHAMEAMECLGGNGVMEDFISARLYREAPINAIWEGSGNIQALDVLRALQKDPAALGAWQRELEGTLSQYPLLALAWRQIQHLLATASLKQARRITELLALTLQGALLAKGAPNDVADAFIRSRLGEGGHSFGTLPPGTAPETLLARAYWQP
ncbi:acyl-CoA dehydrogenase family protein [Gallaecimonas xiamenensis]|uniref:Acyl-CoA dehydrogenase domain-containing protein n=1 Tax=Gallaecimonas xiamenensis 3-C-1 TaxID=745411 RepID=K2ICT8_9GAMM|nr:acyl-CoA dehydrogenase family protein [Gallaecimonas xiamenensis]EKE67761.1 acyl-CoA dehydrogenase domain-containing protein [Gallaecimonas xiamenensis 3-C-1]